MICPITADDSTPTSKPTSAFIRTYYIDGFTRYYGCWILRCATKSYISRLDYEGLAYNSGEADKISHVARILSDLTILRNYGWTFNLIILITTNINSTCLAIFHSTCQFEISDRVDVVYFIFCGKIHNGSNAHNSAKTTYYINVCYHLARVAVLKMRELPSMRASHGVYFSFIFFSS